jgi:tetratricopeptide (TPR) repeat protein
MTLLLKSRKSPILTPICLRFAAISLFVMCALCWQLPQACAQGRQRGGNSTDLESQQGAAELQTAIALTQRGKFREAIPHFLAAHNHVPDEYLVSFNLALCYVGTGQYQQAIELLNQVRSEGRATAEVQDLLAQGYVGNGQQPQALIAFQDAAKLAPKDEKMFVRDSEACMDGGAYELGLKIANLGLQHLPNSGRLHFERGILLVQLDQLDEAKHDLAQVAMLSPGTDIAYIASAQQNLLDGNVTEAMRVAKKGIEKNHSHFMLLTIFGEAALRAGVQPGQPEFAEAQASLEKAAAENPNYPSSQIALGKIYILVDRIDDAIARLTAAGRLDPQNPAVYSNLAAAYRKKGDLQQETEMLTILAKLNKAQAEKIAAAPGGGRAGYGANTSHQHQQ